MYNTIVTKLILFPGVESSFVLRSCGFNIIRKPDINSMFTFSVAIRARESSGNECFNNNSVIILEAVSVSFDSFKSKSSKSASNGVTYFTVTVTSEKFDQLIFCLTPNPESYCQCMFKATGILSENLR